MNNLTRFNPFTELARIEPLLTRFDPFRDTDDMFGNLMMRPILREGSRSNRRSRWM